jgi:hypothetical protein
MFQVKELVKQLEVVKEKDAQIEDIKQVSLLIDFIHGTK